MHNYQRTAYYKPQKQMPATLLIIDKFFSPTIIPLNGNMTMGRDYPESDSDITISSEIVSRRHGEFIYDESCNSYYYIDRNSYNGTYINGIKLAKYNENGSMALKLSDGDIIRIDRKNLADPHPEAVLIIFSTTFRVNERWERFDFSNCEKMTIGRDEKCDLRLNDLMASRNHAIIQFDGNSWCISDTKSKNGIGVNGYEISGSMQVFPNDVIRIANSTLIFTRNYIIYNTLEQEQLSLEIDIKEKTVGKGKVLLKNIEAKLYGGDFVLILGGSGAGKTTLIKSILGESKAQGKIILNGQDLYKNFKQLKSQIGIVPQFLTLRVNDTVKHTLLDTAKIKLGGKYSKLECLARVEQVIDTVGIKEHENKYISQLSGGQQKKVSVANQLIGFQKVFICDEPDSGLDAASRMQQMEILKDISNEGRIVMVISHEPDDAVEKIKGVRNLLFTKVIVLAKSSRDSAGHLAYFGEVADALNFFGVNRLQDIMLEINPVTEGGKGKADEYIEKYNRLRKVL